MAVGAPPLLPLAKAMGPLLSPRGGEEKQVCATCESLGALRAGLPTCPRPLASGTLPLKGGGPFVPSIASTARHAAVPHDDTGQVCRPCMLLVIRASMDRVAGAMQPEGMDWS